MRATGSSVDDLVQRIGLSEPTLRKYYLRELQGGTALARQVLVQAMWEKAVAGNVAAARFIREEFPRGDAAAFIAGTARSAPKPEPRAAPMGKKEAANVAALTAGAGSEWGDDLKPPPAKH